MCILSFANVWDTHLTFPTHRPWPCLHLLQEWDNTHCKMQSNLKYPSFISQQVASLCIRTWTYSTHYLIATKDNRYTWIHRDWNLSLWNPAQCSDRIAINQQCHPKSVKQIGLHLYSSHPVTANGTELIKMPMYSLKWFVDTLQCYFWKPSCYL